ncbi:eukaryotic translation initiation factor 5B isoform X49 [Pyrus x bretschneideri]|uniref:eukaryotic translation initiation factor 5B isoform X49 n=1 Tax=Pyrus x bretschneideri TaxID=225117 RepID=UPI00202EA0F6|nr:eukaryotic translation initiation factor 5B isoform X49 [Pyrus x bretschneideri]
MLPTGVQQPVSFTELVEIYRYYRSGLQSELLEGVAVPINPINNNPVDDQGGHPQSIPSPAPSDLDPEIVDLIRTLDPAVIEWIRNPDPAFLDEIRKSRELRLKEKEEKEEGKERETQEETEKERESEKSESGSGGGGNENGGEVVKEVVEQSSTSKRSRRRKKRLMKVSKDKAMQGEELAEKQDQTESKEIFVGDHFLLKVSKDKAKPREKLAEKQDQTESKQEIFVGDHLVLEVSKDKAKPREGLAEKQDQTENKKKVSKDKAKQREELVEKQVQTESKKKVSKDKAKQREELAVKQDQTESKTKVSKDKAKQREELAEKQDQTKSKKKVSKDKAKQREDLAEKQDQTESKVCNCIDDQSDHPLFSQSPLPSDLNPEILEWIQGPDPTELDRTYAIFDKFQQFDPAFENWNFNPAIVDEIWELSLKEWEKKEEEEKERESEKENEMEREGKSSGIRGGNQNGGDVENEVVAESSRRNQYPLRPKAGDCLLYLKTGSCKFGSNCKFNHPRGRKNKQVCKHKAKQRVELEEKQDQTQSKIYKKKVSKNKAKQKEELAEKQDRTESKHCPGRRKGEPSVAPALELNFLGLPIRPGKKDCWHYMRNGTCKHENNCLFNHPDPTPAEESHPQSAYESHGIHSETTEFITPSWD